ncbi:MAG: acetyl-CoA carboxylase biotin carboxyl carrier protein [Verrucomicrobia bacterium]|nr:acetyl-CoA carboxylase biotin carboxyl carrier protein [Verrucomicrobiota bacterium]MCH8511016.1 acetyl-CoA carboxylase biotin carboxyl carrier protein [Kiritimatiellia bacterium]
MDFKDLKKIIELVKENDIMELELQDGDFRLATKLRGNDPVYVTTSAAPQAPSASPAPSAPQASGGEMPPAPKVDAPSIKSPMVGTFYRSSSPDADPFVKAGDLVEADSTVCIIEAMKVMNEIKAEVTGRITKILVENAEAVEFGQPLFEIEPA